MRVSHIRSVIRPRTVALLFGLALTGAYWRARAGGDVCGKGGYPVETEMIQLEVAAYTIDGVEQPVPAGTSSLTSTPGGAEAFLAGLDDPTFAAGRDVLLDWQQ